MEPGANRNVICLVCRKSGNSLPCNHPHILVGARGIRVPRKSASKKQWQRFLDWYRGVWGACQITSDSRKIPLPEKIP